MMDDIKGYSINLLRKILKDSFAAKPLMHEQDGISYDRINGIYFITDKTLSWEQRVHICATLVKDLSETPPLGTIRVDDIITGFYDQCTNRYLYQRLIRGLEYRYTCWYQLAQANRCIGWLDPEQPFDASQKVAFLEETSVRQRFEKYADQSHFLERDEAGFVFMRSKEIVAKDDDVLRKYDYGKGVSLVSSVKQKPHIILGYSTKYGRFSAISGIRRLAILRFLRSQGRIKNIKVPCHLVTYPYKMLTGDRPYGETCKKCCWGGIYDPGKGTHQDFYVREGIVIMRGHRKKKGGRQKWAIIETVFKEMVQNKTVLDVGAYRGLFCIKALEYGAKKATALEIGDELANVIRSIKQQYNFEDIILIHGDFYDDTDFRQLKETKYDTAFFFGIIHHLLRLGIQKGILHSFDELIARISELVKHGVIIEFAIPRETSLILSELAPYRERFSEDEFKRAMQKYFSTFKNLGCCNYYSENKSGRRMYYGIK